MSVTVEGHRHTVFEDVIVEGVHVAKGAFGFHKTELGQAAGCIVNEDNQTAAIGTAFKPVVTRTVDLDQFAKSWPALAQCIDARLGAAFGTPKLGDGHGFAKRLLGEHQVMSIRQILSGEGGTEVAVAVSDDLDGAGDGGIRDLFVAGKVAFEGSQSLRAMQGNLAF